jgi:HK97 gp10 family phage protein
MRVENWNPGPVTAEIEKRAMDRLEKAGEYVAERARQKFPLGAPPPVTGRKSKKPWMPMSKGDLQKSIRVRRLDGDPHLDIRVIAGSREKNGPFYAHMIERGTIKMGARPFMRPALNGAKSEIMKIMENG